VWADFSRRTHLIATAQFELRRARSTEAIFLRKNLQGDLAEVEPLDPNSALNGLKMVWRYNGVIGCCVERSWKTR
jgi:hypothetical protein